MTATGDSTVGVSGAAGVATPFYFDAGGMSLFGAYHAPSGTSRRSAVVVCPPTGPDYVRTHRGLRQLAIRLAQRGYPTLRFDFSGCGDSAGEASECDVDRWRKDVTAAIGVALARSGMRSVCLVGFRVGAALAAETAQARDDVLGLVLWEPAVSGADYVASLLERHRARFRSFPVLANAAELDEPQALGAPLTERLRQGLDRIDLQTLEPLGSRSVLIVQHEENPATRALGERLESGGAAVEVVVSPAPGAAGDLLYRIVVPHATIETIVAWAARELP